MVTRLNKHSCPQTRAIGRAQLILRRGFDWQAIWPIITLNLPFLSDKKNRQEIILTLDLNLKNGVQLRATKLYLIPQKLNKKCHTKSNLLCLFCRHIVSFLFATQCIFHCVRTWCVVWKQDGLLNITTVMKGGRSFQRVSSKRLQFHLMPLVNRNYTPFNSKNNAVNMSVFSIFDFNQPNSDIWSVQIKTHYKILFQHSI